MSKLTDEYLSVKHVASLFGVTETTIRLWNRKKKLCGYRHPINGRLIYKKNEIEIILENIDILEEW